LSAVARLVTYGVVCACVIALRQKQPRVDAFRLPAGTLTSAVALVFVLTLITQMGVKDLITITGVIVLAFLNWLWAKQKATNPA
jgi:L-asparagine transporter-like permease